LIKCTYLRHSLFNFHPQLTFTSPPVRQATKTWTARTCFSSNVILGKLGYTMNGVQKSTILYTYARYLFLIPIHNSLLFDLLLCSLTKKNGPYPHLRFDQCPLAATKLIISHYQRYCYNLLYWKFSYKDLFFLHIYNISTAVAFNAPMLRSELLYSHPLLEIFILLIYTATTVFLTHLEFTI